MPTGYTDVLDKNGFDTKKWVAESLVRAFGVCVVFREEGHMSEKAILQRFKENAKGLYYDKALKEANTKIEKLKFMSDEEWKTMMQGDNTEKMEYYEETNKERTKIRDGHIKVQNELTNFLTEDISDVTRNIVKFGLEQLCLVEDDYGEYPIPVLFENIEEFKKMTLEKVYKDIDYYEKELVEDRKRETERMEVYKEILGDLNLFRGK